MLSFGQPDPEHLEHKFFRACPEHHLALDDSLFCPCGPHLPRYGKPSEERTVWEVMDAAGPKRVAIVVGGRVRWEEWFENLCDQASGRDAHGFSDWASQRAVQSGDGETLTQAKKLRPPRPTVNRCLVCLQEFVVKKLRGKVPNVCYDCREYGLTASMARIV